MLEKKKKKRIKKAAVHVCDRPSRATGQGKKGEAETSRNMGPEKGNNVANCPTNEHG